VFNKTDLEEIMDGGSGADNADGQHTHATAGIEADAVTEDEIDACESQGTSVMEFDDDGNPTCKKSTQTTISGTEEDGDMLVYDTGSFRDVPMGGDAAMDEDGLVTLTDVPSGGTDGCSAAGDKPIYTASTDSWGCGTDATGGTPATADISDVSVTQTELAELETLGATTIEEADWTAVAAMSGVNTGDDDTPQAGAVTEAMMASEDFGDFTCAGAADDCTLDSGVVDATALDGAMDIITTGTIQGKVAIATDGDGGLLAVNTATLATAAGDYFLPDECDSATGAWVLLYVRDADEIVSLLVTDTNDTIVYKGLSLDTGDQLDSPENAQDSVALVCWETNKWYVTANSGDWTDGGAP
jgi:hypothetical protein